MKPWSSPAGSHPFVRRGLMRLHLVPLPVGEILEPPARGVERLVDGHQS